MSKLSAWGSEPYKNSRVSKSKFIYSASAISPSSACGGDGWSWLICAIALLSNFSEVLFLSPALELPCRRWLRGCSRHFTLSEWYKEDSPSLMGKLLLRSSYSSNYCLLLEMRTPRPRFMRSCSSEELSSGGKMSPSKYSIYFLESYYSKPAEWSDELYSLRIPLFLSTSSSFCSLACAVLASI